MIAEVCDLLHCPHCHGRLALRGGTLGCAAGHRFDLARQGHVTLLRRPATTRSDTAAMVAARVDFLAAGHYAAIRAALVEQAVGSVVAEVGAGPGYYLGGVVDALGSQARGVATDLSAYACRRAARLPRIGAVVADTWAGLPLRDAVVDTLLCVFAPRNPAEFARVLAPGGRLLVVTPTDRHLASLRDSLGLLGVEPDKGDRLRRTLGEHLSHRGSITVEQTLALDRPDLRRLVLMGPNAFHTKQPDVPEGAEVDLSVQVSVFGR